jgi:hypothetical protein
LEGPGAVGKEADSGGIERSGTLLYSVARYQMPHAIAVLLAIIVYLMDLLMIKAEVEDRGFVE